MYSTVITLRHENSAVLPAQYSQDDVRSSDNLVAHLLERFTMPGDVVFDPFAGFGTTLLVAERMGRACYGLEYLPDRADYVRSIITHKERIMLGDARHIERLELPPLDFSFASPPYMSRNNHAEYPFAAYAVTGDGYAQYLRDIKDIYSQLKHKLKPGARAVIEISNIVNDGVVTALAWDVAACVAEVLTLEREIIVAWESGDNGSYGFGYDHCYCLVFRK